MGLCREKENSNLSCSYLNAFSYLEKLEDCYPAKRITS